MKPLALTVSDDELINFVDQWVGLLEREEYQAAFDFTDHVSEMGWSASLIKTAIKSYGDCDSNQLVTLEGKSTGFAQRKDVNRWPTNTHNCFGEIWYDLNINGKVSDLTATFCLVWADEGVSVQLNDIHVM